MDDIVSIGVDWCWLILAASQICILRFIIMFCSFGFVPRRLLVVGPFKIYYPHRVGSFSTVRVLLLRTVKTTNYCCALLLYRPVLQSITFEHGTSYEYRAGKIRQNERALKIKINAPHPPSCLKLYCILAKDYYSPPSILNLDWWQLLCTNDDCYER